MKIETKQGSATSPTPSGGGGVIIAHLCNHQGRWGRGFVLAVNDLSMAAKNAYTALCKDYGKNVPLGTTQFVEIKPNLFVANMIAQNGLDKSKVANGCLVDYSALKKCLETVFYRAVLLKCNVHIPAGMGSGLAGGNKQVIADLIKEVAECSKIDSIEDHCSFVPVITLWEFIDTTAASYVGGAVAPAPADGNDDVVSGVQKALDDFRGIDLSDV